jgi:uncharacterized protein YndB with AHSA1/START domain
MEEIRMKWLKWIGIVLAALLILPMVTLLILGQRKDAGHMHGSIEIAASPQQLFPWLVEGDKLKQWVSWLVEVRVPDPTVHGVGASSVWVMKDENNGGARMQIVAKNREYAPPSRLVLQISVEGEFTGENVYELVDLGNGRTRLEMDSRYRISNWFGNLMEPVVTPAARKKMVADEARLKSIVESKAEVR